MTASDLTHSSFCLNNFFGSYHLQRAEEKMNQFRCVWIVDVFLQFGLQRAQWWTQWEGDEERAAGQEQWRLGAVISHQEVEGQLQFLQAINELCFTGGLGSQGQHTLCKQPEQTSNNDHMQTPGLPACHTDTLQTGCRFHFLAMAQSHKLTDFFF